MHATAILRSEHRVIEQVLDCLVKLVDRGESSGAFDWRSAEQVVDFMRNFADGCHHAKEEEQLFPALDQRGLSPDLGPTAVMREEHAQGRRHIKAIADAVAHGLRGDYSHANEFATHARAYIELLRQHIQKEDHCLFPMAERLLSEADHEELVGAFGRVESAPQRAGCHDNFLQLADRLADRFGVPQSVQSLPEVGANCGHHH